MQSTTSEGETIIFKTLPVSKIVYLAVTTKILNQIIPELEIK